MYIITTVENNVCCHNPCIIVSKCAAEHLQYVMGWFLYLIYMVTLIWCFPRMIEHLEPTSSPVGVLAPWVPNDACFSIMR